MTDIYLCRHGRTQLNMAGLLRGRLDPGLDLIGVAEARDLARHLRGLAIDQVLSSPLTRAVQTAAPIARAAGLEVRIDTRLLDRDYGEFDGTRESEVTAAYGSLDAAPGVEPAAAVVARARAVLDEVAALADRTVVVVSHDAVIRLLLDTLAPTPRGTGHLSPRTGSWSLLRHDDLGWWLVAVNRKDDPVETVPTR